MIRYWVGQKVYLGFLVPSEKPEQTFWLTHYIEGTHEC